MLLRTILFVNISWPCILLLRSLFYSSLTLLICFTWWPLSCWIWIRLPRCINRWTRISRWFRTYCWKSWWIWNWIICSLIWLLLGIIRLWNITLNRIINILRLNVANRLLIARQWNLHFVIVLLMCFLLLYVLTLHLSLLPQSPQLLLIHPLESLQLLNLLHSFIQYLPFLNYLISFLLQSLIFRNHSFSLLFEFLILLFQTLSLVFLFV